MGVQELIFRELFVPLSCSRALYYPVKGHLVPEILAKILRFNYFCNLYYEKNILH